MALCDNISHVAILNKNKPMTMLCNSSFLNNF